MAVRAAAAALGADIRKRCQGGPAIEHVVTTTVDLLHQIEIAHRKAPLLTFGFVADACGPRLVASRGPQVDAAELAPWALERRPTFLVAPVASGRFVDEYQIASAFGFSAQAAGRAIVVGALSRATLSAEDVEPLRVAALALATTLLDARETRGAMDEGARLAARLRVLDDLCDAHATLTQEADRAAQSLLDETIAKAERAATQRQSELVDHNEKLRRMQRAMLNVIEDLREARARLEERVAERTKRYHATFHQAAVGIAEVALDGRWMNTNARLCQILGYSAEELCRRTFQDVTHPDDLEADLARVRELLAGTITTYTMEKRYVRKDHRVVWVLLTVSLVRRDDGSPEYFISVVQDIDDNKRVERERDELLLRERLAREEAQRTSRFAEQFIGMLGHDLRNPLNAVMMAAQVLQRTAGADVDRKRLERIVSSGRRMGNMVSQLLDLTRSRLAGGIPVDRRHTELDAIVRAAVDELQVVHPKREIRVSLNGQLAGHWDAERLAQVVSNLVGNALQHGDAARPVEVRLEEREGDALLEVQSFGATIPPELLPVLFEPYRRGAARESKSHGLGLGLFISKQIVLAHGGRMGVASTPEQGTTFTVILPRSSRDGAALPCP